MCVERPHEFLFGRKPIRRLVVQTVVGAAVSLMSVHESYVQEELAMAEMAAVTPSATAAMKSRFNVSSVSVGR